MIARVEAKLIQDLIEKNKRFRIASANANSLST